MIPDWPFNTGNSGLTAAQTEHFAHIRRKQKFDRPGVRSKLAGCVGALRRTATRNVSITQFADVAGLLGADALALWHNICPSAIGKA